MSINAVKLLVVIVCNNRPIPIPIRNHPSEQSPHTTGSLTSVRVWWHSYAISCANAAMCSSCAAKHHFGGTTGGTTATEHARRITDRTISASLSCQLNV